MKTCNLFKNIFVATVILFVAGAAELWAADPQIVITYIPPIGGQGNAEGKIIWDQWTPENAGQYAIIAILRTSSDYVKPAYNDYLSQISASGSFSVNITTHPNDYPEPDFSFYLVRKETFNGVNGATVTSWTMAGKYLGEPVHINRETFWNDKLKLPESNIRPGFVAAGTAVTLSCGEGETVYYTLDGSDPATVQYNGESFTVPSDGFLLIKAITRKDGKESDPASMLWMPYESYSTPLFGLNVSLALNGENFGYTLSESKTEERMKPVIPLAKWIRTFGTLNNGLPYINKIAKQAGMRTMIGVYISNSPSDNNAQLIGLRQILQTGHLPDLIAVGNEASQSGISSEIIAESVDAVRRMLKEFNLFIPVGSVDVGNMAWSQSVLNRLDFVGVNLYPSTWDCTPEEEMINVLKESYSRELSSFKSKCVLITETGTPYAKDPYTPSNTNCTQTPSENKAKSYLEEVIKWSGEDSIPLFYFEAYDEETKKGNHPIEEYFGLMDGNLKIHSFYKDVLKMSDDATLSSLTVSAGTLSPEFDVNTTGYTVNVLSDVTDITVTGTANHPSATVDGNVTDKSLEVGNTVVSITVTAEDRTTAMTYTVTVVRAK
ncbi:MAG: cadherin-like beta sandwich domain-containing protein, partial [Prevotellaceae bacterium]|nr:cadherin-like beta sandwich domain-containing protein [Prevotellaceae bacterium]